MHTKPEFHGSDLEKISKYYGISKDSIISFGANVNPLGLSESIKKQLSLHLDLLSSYPDRNYDSLRQVIGTYCNTSSGNVLVGNGSSELIALLIEQIHPKNALVLGPTYSEYARELSFSNCHLEYYNLRDADEFRLDVDDFCTHLTGSLDLLILCNPNNPTSSGIPQKELERILFFCNEMQIFVMIDETYVEFVPETIPVTAMPFIDTYDNLMILRGVSKFFAAPGLRLGYGITGNQALLAKMKEHQIPWSLNSIGAYAGELMLQDTNYIHATKTLINTERALLFKELNAFNGLTPYPALANFILLKITKEGVTSHEVFEHCIREGLMIRDCSSFQSLEGEFIRFCIMKPEDNARLLEVLRKVFQ